MSALASAHSYPALAAIVPSSSRVDVYERKWVAARALDGPNERDGIVVAWSRRRLNARVYM